jgi:hypothetical protein
MHAPPLPESVKEAKEKLMPSKMLFSIRDPERVIPKPKHEQVLGLYTAQQMPTKAVHTFTTEQEALEAINKGAVPLSDEVG